MIEVLRERLAAAGLDLLAPFHTGWAAGLPGAPLPQIPGSASLPGVDAPGGSLAVMVGNTRALWDPFLTALRADVDLRGQRHPLDAYVARAIRQAAEELPVRSAVALSSESPPVAMQRLAHAIGLAWLSPAYLSVHAEHGPWIALRGVIVLDAGGPPGPAPGTTRPCHACETACLPALRVAMSGGPPPDHAAIAAAGDRWIALRDACPLGRGSRYGEEQLHYHYGKDRERLLRVVRGP